MSQNDPHTAPHPRRPDADSDSDSDPEWTALLNESAFVASQLDSVDFSRGWFHDWI